MAGKFSRKRETYCVWEPQQVAYALEQMGIEIVGETETNFLCFCPKHSNTSTPAFSVSKTKGLFICLNPSCGFKGTIEMLTFDLLGAGPFETKRLLMRGTDHTTKIKLKQFDYEPFDPDEIERFKFKFRTSESAIEYCKKRNISKRAVEFFNIGFDRGCIQIPMYDSEGRPVGCIGRSIVGKKFFNSRGLPKSHTLWNIHNAKKFPTVIVVESCTDAIRLWQVGYENVVALLGGGLSEDLGNMLCRYFEHIVIMTDNDEAGRKMGNSIAALPRPCSWVVFEGKDADELDDKSLVAAVENAVTNLEYGLLNDR